MKTMGDDKDQKDFRSKFDFTKASVDTVLLCGNDGPVPAVEFTDVTGTRTRYLFAGHRMAQDDMVVDLERLGEAYPNTRRLVMYLRDCLLDTDNDEYLLTADKLDWMSYYSASKFLNDIGAGKYDQVLPNRPDWFVRDLNCADEDMFRVYPSMLEHFEFSYVPKAVAEDEGKDEPSTGYAKQKAGDAWPEKPVVPEGEFSCEQVAAIEGFHDDLVDFIDGHLVSGSPLTAREAYEFDSSWLHELADEVADACANHGVLVRYPERVTYPDGFVRVSNHPYPDDHIETERFVTEARNADRS